MKYSNINSRWFLFTSCVWFKKRIHKHPTFESQKSYKLVIDHRTEFKNLLFQEEDKWFYNLASCLNSSCWNQLDDLTGSKTIFYKSIFFIGFILRLLKV